MFSRNLCVFFSSLFFGQLAHQVVILPGAFVPTLAYAPLARNMARKGHPSYVVRFDFDVGKYALLSSSLIM